MLGGQSVELVFTCIKSVRTMGKISFKEGDKYIPFLRGGGLIAIDATGKGYFLSRPEDGDWHTNSWIKEHFSWD